MNCWAFKNNYFEDYRMNYIKFLIPFILIDLVLRGFALWKSAKRNQNIWFIALLIVNSIGILPLIYLILNKKTKSQSPQKAR